MLTLLFHCPACDLAAERDSFPLCGRCRGALVPCPLLCPACASPACAGECDRPWAASGALRSCHALYLLAGPGYRVLRRWKVRRGPLFDRIVLDPALLPSELRQTRFDAVIPVPQRSRRAWSLGGASPAWIAARWVARELGVPLVPALEHEPPRASGLVGARIGRAEDDALEARQAERALADRLANRMRFRFSRAAWSAGRGPEGASALLVDDFMTSGKTLRSAAEALSAGGLLEVRALCLGLRPLLGLDAEKHRHLA